MVEILKFIKRQIDSIARLIITVLTTLSFSYIIEQENVFVEPYVLTIISIILCVWTLIPIIENLIESIKNLVNIKELKDGIKKMAKRSS